MADLRCNSCNKDITNDKGCVKFKCPSCSKVEIVRCYHCRSIGTKYNCSCGFSGPN